VDDERRLDELQRRFAAHLRDPAHAPAPEGIEDGAWRSIANCSSTTSPACLAGTFPVLHAILGAERWQRLVRDFYRLHRCHTPLFLEIPREFLDYLGDEREAAEDDPPFLYELAHYEWVELALAIDGRNWRPFPPSATATCSRACRFSRRSPGRSPIDSRSTGCRRTSSPSRPGRTVVLRGPRDRDDHVGFVHVNARDAAARAAAAAGTRTDRSGATGDARRRGATAWTAPRCALAARLRCGNFSTLTSCSAPVRAERRRRSPPIGRPSSASSRRLCGSNSRAAGPPWHPPSADTCACCVPRG